MLSAWKYNFKTQTYIVYMCAMYSHLNLRISLIINEYNSRKPILGTLNDGYGEEFKFIIKDNKRSVRSVKHFIWVAVHIPCFFEVLFVLSLC